MATLQNLGVLKYRDKDGNWKPLPVVLQSSGGGGSGGISTISGKGKPTESTVGRLNQLYRDESTDKLYICTGVEGGYTWAAVVSDTEDAVTYTAQTLTEEQKTQARANIGAGTSNFSGSYNDLTNKPNIPAASVIDTTLTKSGQAADAKAAGDAIEKKLNKAQGEENAGRILGVDEDGNVVPQNKPVQALAGAAAPTTATAGVVGQEYYVIVDNAVTEMYVCTSALIGSYTWNKVEFGGGTSNAVQYTEQSLTDTQKQQARTNIGAGTSNFSGSYNDLTNTPVLDTTLEQSGKPADAKAVGDAIGSAIETTTTILGASKVDKSQGTENAGKILGIGASGIVTPVDKPVYTLPIATPTVLGGVKPMAKTTAMTQDVGVSDDGKLYTAPSGGGTDNSLGITSATVGQIAKITAVDSAGKPTGWEPVDMPTQKTLKWITVQSFDLTETKRELIISTDTDGKSIADYNPVGLSLILSTPADATQTDNDGAPWVYPSATKKDNSIRVIGTIAGWKTTARDSVFAFYGGSSAMTCTGNKNTQLATYKIDGYALDGVTAMLNGNANHFPVGTHVEVSILCEVPDANVMPA